MTDHPITPPPELISQWLKQFYGSETMPGMAPGEAVLLVAAVAARWGADQELEACCEWLDFYAAASEARDLRTARRPKPPSLKERLSKAIVEGDERQALKLLEELDDSL